mmetsp:Transcript_15474/g.25773  ORF Transcript_15474/g.25773 Transcript_15474/m.25773 type:complete len:117 (-) Transcript_15474:244-594(-)
MHHNHPVEHYIGTADHLENLDRGPIREPVSKTPCTKKRPELSRRGKVASKRARLRFTRNQVVRSIPNVGWSSERVDFSSYIQTPEFGLKMGRLAVASTFIPPFHVHMHENRSTPLQ